MIQSANGSTTYVLGHSADEQERLDRQGALLRPVTERVLHAAGLGPGMRVLDAGCGTGDVTLLAAELVGPVGTVVGVDREPTVLATAASRVRARGWDHVAFHRADLSDLPDSEPFDAVVGRLVLMYQRDPGATLRRLMTLVRPGGSLAFVEIVLVAGQPAPGRALFHHTYQLVTDAFARSGAHPDMGLRLAAAFHNAGLPAPELLFHPVTPIGPDPAWLAMLAGVTRSLLPAIDRFGLATAESVGIDTLLDRLLAEAETSDNAVAGPLYVGAWTRQSSAAG